MMKQLIEYDLDAGGSILIEIDEASPEDVIRVSRGSEVVAKARQSFDSVLESITPATAAIADKLRNLSSPIDKVTVEFGLKFGAKAGAFIASADSEANFKITLTLTPKAGSK